MKSYVIATLFSGMRLDPRVADTTGWTRAGYELWGSICVWEMKILRIEKRNKNYLRMCQPQLIVACMGWRRWHIYTFLEKPNAWGRGAAELGSLRSLRIRSLFPHIQASPLQVLP